MSPPDVSHNSDRIFSHFLSQFSSPRLFSDPSQYSGAKTTRDHSLMTLLMGEVGKTKGWSWKPFSVCKAAAHACCNNCICYNLLPPPPACLFSASCNKNARHTIDVTYRSRRSAGGWREARSASRRKDYCKNSSGYHHGNFLYKWN